MALPPFAVTYDYRCPFARNVHEHLLAGMDAGAGWDVRFVPYSLSQAKSEPEQRAWDTATDSGLLAMAAGLAVRELDPSRFPAAHHALFALRHDEAGDLRDEASVRGALAGAGADADAVLAEVASGRAVELVRREHERAVADHGVWGVPTFIAEGRAAFVRLMDRPRDGGDPVATITRLVELMGWPELNELKHTSIPR